MKKLIYKNYKVYKLNELVRNCKIQNEYHLGYFMHFYSYLLRGNYNKIEKKIMLEKIYPKKFKQ